MNATAPFIPLLTKKEAAERGLEQQITHTEILGAAVEADFQKILADLQRSNIPAGIVIERETRSATHVAVWRGNPPLPAPTRHQQRKTLYSFTV